MTDVLIHSPYPRQRSQGNAVTAKRMTELLRDKGFKVAIHERGDTPIKARCLIALNARKSADEIFKFQKRQPGSPVIALLTGTDVNHPDMVNEVSSTRKALDLATSIVSLHDGFSHRIPRCLLTKTEVIYPSLKLPDLLDHCPEDPWSIVIAGNFRDEKNPSLMMHAARQLVDIPMHFHAYGARGEYQIELEKTAAECPYFHFHGVQEHEVILEKMKSAHVLLNTSREEGGANAICEAVAIGLPVIASRIAGNIGMLGEGYAGFFPSESITGLTETLGRVAEDTVFYGHLKAQISTRAPLFSYQTEAERWAALVRKLLK